METSRAFGPRMTEGVIAQIPAGDYAFEDALVSSPPPLIPPRWGGRVGARMTVDFAGSAPQVTGNLNVVEAVVRSATWYCVRLLAREQIPVNHGCFEPVEVRVPERSVLNPDFPTAVAIGNVETSQRIVDVAGRAGTGAAGR